MEEAYGNVGSNEQGGRLDEVKAKAHQAGETAKKKLAEKADEQKEQLVSRFEQLARNLDELGEKSEGPEGQLFSHLSGYVRKAEGALEGKRADELAGMAFNELKQRPGLLLASCFAAGFLGARLLK